MTTSQKIKCDHVVGYESDCEGLDIIYLSETNHHPKCSIDRLFSFCPECGKSLKDVKFRKAARPEKQDPLMRVMNEEILKQMVKKAKEGSNLVKLLKSDTFPENMGNAIRHVTFERNFTTDSK